MAVKKLEDFTEEEVSKLEQTEYDNLVQEGQIEVPDTPATDKEPEKEPLAEPEGVKPPEAKKDEEPPAPPAKTPEQEQAEDKERLAKLERENAGLREDLIRQRHKRQESKVEPEQSEMVKRILALEDGDLITAGTVKEGINADQRKQDELNRLQQARQTQVEESKELAMARYSDYEQVVKEALPAYIASLPESRREVILKTIAESVDPAELAYTYGQRGVSLVKKEEAPAGGPEKEKTKPPLKTPAETPPVILRSGKSGSPSVADMSLAELVDKYTPEQLEKMAQETEKERTQGG
jgi:hypothetical protein